MCHAHAHRQSDCLPGPLSRMKSVVWSFCRQNYSIYFNPALRKIRCYRCGRGKCGNLPSSDGRYTFVRFVPRSDRINAGEAFVHNSRLRMVGASEMTRSQCRNASSGQRTFTWGMSEDGGGVPTLPHPHSRQAWSGCDFSSMLGCVG